VGGEDWRGAASLLLTRFQTFVHAVREGVLSEEESELFSLLIEADLSEAEEDLFILP
jgi:hypothetical protein